MVCRRSASGGAWSAGDCAASATAGDESIREAYGLGPTPYKPAGRYNCAAASARVRSVPRRGVCATVRMDEGIPHFDHDPRTEKRGSTKAGAKRAAQQIVRALEWTAWPRVW